ncbi:MAG TPA: hypothetical protein VGM90_03280 [Kofleriaceae bacterium]|jgi:hypothetical protein
MKDLIASGRRCSAHIREFGDPEDPILSIVEDNLREFDAIDPASDGFCYPLDHSGTVPTLGKAPQTISLRLLNEAMEAVAVFFFCVRSELLSRLDYVA